MIDRLVIVLGKRLVGNQLTPEGEARIGAAFEALSHCDVDRTVLAICGGYSDSQTQSESAAMKMRFESLCLETGWDFPPAQVVIEQRSTNTIENMTCMAQTLLSSGVVNASQTIAVTLVSTDYHLKRILMVEKQMPEQGLLRLLIKRCAQHGLHLDISPSQAQHVSAPYPYAGERGQLFALVDQLTLYRVFLEGYQNRCFRDNVTNRHQAVFYQTRDTLQSVSDRLNDAQAPALVSVAGLLGEMMMLTKPPLRPESVSDALMVFDHNLTLLNRWCDPEQGHVGRWWGAR
ncbi:YdcF family protein [Vibrio sp. V39_P1S14PM300]|uniref:YdcF family protein n=1 Tax=Vibrio sp. V39_P1S14PM300 TaxID=1938690 RepID=UPI001372EA2A|nr:YdcF family protein [Vibrio sp. V39_P1S14PM300]NAX19694.1 YdcF family protein [Vibrio sp. V39_P1S14PM300]